MSVMARFRQYSGCRAIMIIVSDPGKFKTSSHALFSVHSASARPGSVAAAASPWLVTRDAAGPAAAAPGRRGYLAASVTRHGDPFPKFPMASKIIIDKSLHVSSVLYTS